METFVAIVHIFVALILIFLILIQDSKSGSLGGAFGGGGSNSLLGATGAVTLASKATRWMGVLFAITCISLTYFASRQNRSVIDGTVISSPAAPTSQDPAALPELPANPPANSEPTAPTTPPAANQ